MNKKISLGAAVALLLIVAAFVFSITMNYATTSFNRRVTDLRNREAMWEKYAEIDRLVRESYYGDINETQLMNSVSQGYLSGIGDKYGRYLSAEEYKKIVQDTSGDNAGIGAVIEVAPDDFYLQVVEVYPDSPAEVAGIEPGDLIIRIDDVDLTRENSRQMLEAIQGPQGSNISIVIRRGATEYGPHQMTRRAVAVPTVLGSRILEDSSVGYLQIREFRDRTYDQFNRELIRLMDGGATSLIIDLRDNQSDNLGSATRVLDKLLPAGVLVSAAYRDGRVEVLETSDANAINLPVVVLINAGTTGCGELFAQTIRDFETGRTVGTTTAGKGVIQEIIKLSDGSAIELSVALYLSPSGQSFNGTGVRADFDIPMEQDWKALPDGSGDLQLNKAKEVAISLTTSDSAANQQQPSPEAEDDEADGQAESSSEAEASVLQEETPAEPEPASEEEEGSAEEEESSGDSQEEGED